MPPDSPLPRELSARAFHYTLNGQFTSTDDPIQPGREILKRGGFTPPSDHILIQKLRPGTKSIGLDETVHFNASVAVDFRAFQSDRTFQFTVDELGYEWGADTISEAELRDIVCATDDKIFILERTDQADQPIQAGTSVNLNPKGTEHLRTQIRSEINIIVNGRHRTVKKKVQTYKDIARLAYPDANFDQYLYTITYFNGEHGREGDLVEGEKVHVVEGMVFNVRRSDKS